MFIKTRNNKDIPIDTSAMGRAIPMNLEITVKHDYRQLGYFPRISSCSSLIFYNKVYG